MMKKQPQIGTLVEKITAHLEITKKLSIFLKKQLKLTPNLK